MSGPLTGVRVLDLTHVLNGPFCTVMLAHMGAEVLKVEYGAGDQFRHAWIPPEVKRDGYEFLMVNSNKKGITINLKHEKGQHIFRELVKRADVVVENFSLGVMDRLGLGYDTLRALNPRIIYACSRGFGDSGPYKHVRSNASIVMAMSGWQHAAGEAAGRAGVRSMGVGDEAAGVSMALGICAALYNREVTGTGQRIEVSMQEAIMGFMNSTFHTHFEGHPVGGPPKACADGHYALHFPIPGTDEFWQGVCRAMGSPELADDPRFRTAPARLERADEVAAVVDGWLARKTRRELWEIFTEFGLSSGPVLSLDEVMEDPHIEARKAFVEVEHPEYGTLTLLAPWVRFSETPSEIVRAAPLVGQDNHAVYGELLGLSAAEVEQLAEEGAI